jgi:hypothetical protein
MKMKSLLIIFIVLLFALSLYFAIHNSAVLPTVDLASPSQAKRDAAAKILRNKVVKPVKFKWLFLTWQLKTNESQTNVLELLRSHNLNTRPESGMGGLGEYDEYRLDDYWLLGCEFNNYDYRNLLLERWKLIPRWRDVFVKPATNFNGVWITYFANGQKSAEANYLNGELSGEYTGFFPEDGSKMVVWHYEHYRPNGSFVQFFHSGQIQYQGQFSNYVRIGIWVRYNENGSTNFIKDYSKP